MLAALAMTLALPAEALAGGLPKGVTVDTSMQMRWSYTTKTRFKNGRRKTERSGPSNVEVKYRIFRKGDYVLVFSPKAAQGTVFAGGETIRNVGYKAGIGSFECVEVVYEGGRPNNACARYRETSNGFRIDTTDSDGYGFKGSGSITVEVLPGDCRTGGGSDTWRSVERPDIPAEFPLPPDVAEVVQDHKRTLARSSCRLLKGTKTF